jgi:hypothetical protein
VTLAPPGPDAAVTTAHLDLGQGSGRVARTIRLASKLAVAGRLLPRALGAGATVIAVDLDASAERQVPTAVVDADGVYLLAVDPGRPYRLFVEPAPLRGLARIPLGPIAGDQDVPLTEHRIPAGVAITGVATVEGTPVAGALVQAYCVGGSSTARIPAPPASSACVQSPKR